MCPMAVRPRPWNADEAFSNARRVQVKKVRGHPSPFDWIVHIRRRVRLAKDKHQNRRFGRCFESPASLHFFGHRHVNTHGTRFAPSGASFDSD
jgi:hypothetical protein